jgi:hypothetical protein
VIFRILNAVMTALFGLAVVVQYNDPDPLRWMLVYGAAGLVSARVVARGRTPLVPPLLVGLVAVVWAAGIHGAYDLATLAEMFGAWEMRTPRIEEAREASGLFMIATWMTVLVIHSLIARRQQTRQPLLDTPRAIV